MVTRQGRELLAGLAAATVGVVLVATACSDDTVSPGSTSTSTTTALTEPATTAVRAADGVSVTPDGQVVWEYDLVVWLEADGSDDQFATIAADIAGAEQIASADFFDRGATMAEFERIFADEPELLEAVDPGDLPPSWRVRLADCGNGEVAEELSSWFEAMAGVRSVVVASVAVVVAC